MKDKLQKLIDVKSIVTLLLTLIFSVLAVCGTIGKEEFMEVFKLIIIFYFGTQVGKREANEDNKITGE